MIYPASLRSRIFNITLTLISIVALIYILTVIGGFLSKLSSLFLILLTAWVISIILKPLVEYMKKAGIPAALSILLSFLILFLTIIILGIFVLTPLYQELNIVAIKLSGVNLNAYFNNIFGQLHLNNVSVNDAFLSRLNDFVSTIISNSINIFTNILSLLFNLTLSFFFAFFFLYEGEAWKNWLIKKIPNNHKGDFILITNSITEGIHGFLKGQAIIALIVAVLTMIFMKILGMNLLVVAGLYVFLSLFLPIIGPFVAIIVPLLIASTFSLGDVIILFILLFLTMQVVFNFIQPKIFSKSLGLHPVLVFIAVLAGAELFGFAGALFALPFASVVQSLIIHYYNK